MKQILDWKAIDIERAMLDRLSARVASRYGVFPVGMEEGILRLAAPPDLSREAKEDLKVLLGFEPRYTPVPKADVTGLIARWYGVGAGAIESLSERESDPVKSHDFEIIDHAKDDTMISLVNELFLDALACQASDVHIEPFERTLGIRYRVDGLLRDAHVSEKIRLLAPGLASRIKIMAQLDIGEKRLPQDGRIKIKHEKGELDLRVSVLPSSYGEAIVVRILKPLELLRLDDLGFDATGISRIRRFLKKPHGVVLITGPTGSGKTTTLYSCLRELNQTERKIITVEDPVEYKLTGLIQVQVNPKIDFTFAKALRSILRHDPDCIMIGEIRDGETAEIAIRAALTGHLVFSTLHTNDAPSAITRLVEMGVEPYLVSSALEAVIAQRLVRKACAACRNTPDRSGCPVCAGTGYRGRLAVAEIMGMDEEMRGLALGEQAGSRIRRAALAKGMISLHEDGLAKAKIGLTHAEEIERVISDEG